MGSIHTCSMSIITYLPRAAWQTVFTTTSCSQQTVGFIAASYGIPYTDIERLFASLEAVTSIFSCNLEIECVTLSGDDLSEAPIDVHVQSYVSGCNLLAW